MYSINEIYYLYKHPLGYSLLSRKPGKPTSTVAHFNKSGGEILSYFDKGSSIEDVISHIKEVYGNSAANDAKSFIRELHKFGILVRGKRKTDAIVGSENLFLPVTLQLEVTERCIQSCKHCYIKNVKMPERLNATTIKSILDEFRPYNLPLNVQVTGGEPFLLDDIWEIFDVLDKYPNLRWALYTTGIVVDEGASIRLSQYKNLYEIHVSLDGNKEIHDSLRGKGSYEKTIKGIKKLNKYNANKIQIGCMLRHGMVEKTMEEIIKLIDELGISRKRLNLGYIIPVGRGESMKGEVPTMEEFAKGVELTHKYGIERSDFNRWKERDFTSVENFSKMSHKLGIGEGNCGAGYISVAITPNGDVYPCTIMVSYSQFKMGNIFEDSFEKIFRTEAERWVYRKTPSRETCGDCKYLPYCSKCFGFEIAFCKTPGWLLYEGKNES